MVLLNSFSLFSKVQRYPYPLFTSWYFYRPYSHCELNPKNIYISWKVQRPFIYFYPICVRTPSISSGHHSQPTFSLCSSLIAYDTLSMSYAHAAKLESIADPKRYFIIGGVYVMGNAEKTHLYSRPMILNMPIDTNRCEFDHRSNRPDPKHKHNNLRVRKFHAIRSDVTSNSNRNVESMLLFNIPTSWGGAHLPLSIYLPASGSADCWWGVKMS